MTGRTRTKSLGLAPGLVLGLSVLSPVACSPDAAPPSADSGLPEWSIGSEARLSIGEMEGVAEYLFARVASARLLEGGRVAVADRGRGTIRIYGPGGEFERAMGREGDGPGEFRYIRDLRVREPDTLAVYDAMAFRLTRFLASGELLPETVTFRADDGRPEIYVGRFAGGDHAAAWIRQEPRNPTSITVDRMRMARFGPDGERRGLLGTDVGMRRLGSPTPFSPHFLGVVIGDSVYHTDGLTGAIRVTGASGEFAGSLRADLEPMGFDRAWSALEVSLDSAGARRLREMRGTPGLDSVPVISALLVDDAERLWLKRYDPSVDSHWRLRQRTGGEWRVLERDGTAVATVSVPAGFRLLDVRGDRAAGLTRDELGVERVEVRTLTRR